MVTAKPIACTPILLRHATITDYCNAVRRSRHSSFWWYFFDHAFFRYSLPFRIRDESWWYQVKPGFCWPVEVLTPRHKAASGFPYCKSFIGFQHCVDESLRNSAQIINVIDDLPKYTVDCIDAKRRNAVRKGLRECIVEPLHKIDEKTVLECCAVWSDFTRRTGWKHPVSQKCIKESWSEMLDLPGATILIGREIQSGKIAGFLITKVLGDTAFVDTLASKTDMLHTNINDTLIFAFLVSAQRISGIKKAHFAIRSYDEHLEAFKTSIGFKPLSFPMYTCIRQGLSPIIRRLFPAKFRRITNGFD